MTGSLKITIWRVDYANPLDRWQACVDDYDLDKDVGFGATPRDAVMDLLDKDLAELDGNHDVPAKRQLDSIGD